MSDAALAGTLTADDLGPGWSEYPADAEVIGEESSGRCREETGLLDGVAEEDISEGEIIQYEDRLVFVQTETTVFGSAAEAEAYARAQLTPTFIECRRVELEEGVAEVDPTLSVALVDTHEGDGGSPYVGSFFYETRQEVDGVVQPVSDGSRHGLYVVDTTVIDLFTQIALTEDDPADLSETTDVMVNAAMDVVLERVAS